MEELGQPAGHVVAVSPRERGAAGAGTRQLERGRLAVAIEIEGLPVGDLPAGARLRIGEAVLVELLGLHPASGRRAAREEGPGGLMEAGATEIVPADVLEPGAVVPGDRVALEAVALPLADVLDLHSFRPEETSRVVREYLDEARRAGIGEVRIIHGRGRGVQRATIQRLLAEAPEVAAFADAPPSRGGWGATVVRLRRAEGAPSA